MTHEVRRHTRITASGKRVTVRRHKRDGGTTQTPARQEYAPPAVIETSWTPGDDTAWDEPYDYGDAGNDWTPDGAAGWDDPYWQRGDGDVITHDDEADAEPLPDIGPTPYPHDRAKAELFVFACQHVGLPPEDVMKMPAVRDRFMQAIG